MIDPVTLTFTIVGAAVAVIVLALVVWIVLGARKVGRAVTEIERSRAALATARTQRDAATGTEVAAAEDAVQAARRASNAATREGEALRRRFPTSMFAGRIPAAAYEESGGGTAEPPRIAF
ncbi:hypothetical protein [Agrococcus jejuensis]|uniref:Uncharacterized protein n=1 Tax=Agrococcus jejuensis TaxID=399736 RepID=A0A1G8FQ40_9MICO|nr:hypothetical protein [Agrococcus jejuensis]SDH84214.1 hypothetical protein SAMN04489720_2568 [Agrococcus jejuensis]